MEKKSNADNLKNDTVIQDLNYKVDFKKEKYFKNFKNISQIFEDQGGYLNFIRNVKNPILKEIYVLMRKYQNFFSKLKINENLIFDFSKSGGCSLNDLISYFKKESDNKLTIEIEILPKFKKNEINFSLPEDVLRCKFELILLMNENNDIKVSQYENTSVEFLNFDFNSKLLNSETLTNIHKLTNNLLITFLNEYSENFVTGVNKFITYLENYFPQIVNQSLSKSKKEMILHWSQEELNLLEAALIKFKNEKNVKEKFQKIADEVKTKTISDCIKRYKELAKINLNENAKTKENLEEKKEENKKLTNSTPNKQEGETKKPIEIKEKESSVLKNTKENKKFEPFIYKFTNTNDLVDEIINQFNNLYSTVKFEPLNKLGDEAFDEENLDELNEYDDSDNEYTDENMLNKNEFDEEDEIENYDPNKYKTSSHENNNKFIKNLVLFGEKHSLLLEGFEMKNIGLAEIVDLTLHLKCINCKKIAFESKFYKLNRNSNVLYCGAVCQKCNNHMHVLVKSEFIHQTNIHNAGTIFSIGVIITDILATNYLINCMYCEDSFKKINLRTGSLQHKDRNCRTCQKELMMSVDTIKLSATSKTHKSFIQDLKIENFVKFNLDIKDYSDSNYAKLYDRVGQVGNALPDNGTCQHYSQSFRWFRFGCCGRVYPCDECHDKEAGHKSEYAHQNLCGFCSFEQGSQNNLCSRCGKMFTKVVSNKGFWEGGKGTRSKNLMSNKDSHKFKNSGMKTISRKKQRENHPKQGNK